MSSSSLPFRSLLRLSVVLLAPAFLLAPIAAQCCDQLSHARSSATGASAGSVMLIAGGFDGTGPNQNTEAVDLYDTANGSWSDAELSIARYGMGGASVGTRALFAGGGFFSPTFMYVLQTRVDIYDASTGLWSTAALSSARMGLAGTSVGNVALFAGGFDTPQPPIGMSAVVDLYDASSGSWSTASLSQGRAGLAATSVGDFALFAGGSAASGASAVVDLYHGPSGTWTATVLSAPRSGLAATSAGRFALFAGGFDANGTSDVVDLFDVTTGQWSTATLSAPRSSLAAVSVGERAFFAGGTLTSDPTYTPSARVDVFDASNGTWSSFELCEARYALAAAACAGQALFAGGSTTSQSATAELLPAGFPRAYCFGDGSGATCPCGNAGAAGRGCASSSGAGARLDGAGCTSVAADGLALNGTELVAGQPVLCFAGLNATAGGSGLPFGDGLRCAGGDVVRLGTKTIAPDGSVAYGPGLGAVGGWVAGDLRRFQLWYRDPSGACGAGFNLSNGLEVGFVP